MGMNHEQGKLDGKVAIITGGARGQGRSHALTLAKEGANIVIGDICRDIPTLPYSLATENDLQATVADVEALGRKALGVKCDVSQAKEAQLLIEETIAAFGKIDILVANHGIWHIAPSFWEMSEEAWDDSLDVNLKGVWLVCRFAAPYMISRRFGKIIIISSSNGLRPAPHYVSYVAGKHGVIGLMGAIALELAPHNINVNAICPGVVDTPNSDHQVAYDLIAGHPGGTREDRELGARRAHVLADRGLLDPESISRAVLWLASEDARDITGVSLSVDAGFVIKP